MDEKGFAFTPLTYLLIIPVMVIAISYGNIIDEANLIGSLITGGDVTYSSATTLFSAMEKGANDAGRNSAYNASRKVVDDHTFFTSGTSKNYIKNNIIAALNVHIVDTALKIQHETGRQVYINNILIDDYTDKPFNTNNVNITQTDPFGFNIEIKGGIPIKIVQQDKDQAYELKTPDMSTYVTIEGLEDPYIWIYTKERRSNVIYKYQYATVIGSEFDYYFDSNVDTENNRLHYLWECLNGTDNPSNIPRRPNYFPDPNGLSFFDRLEGKNSSTENANVRMSTFILGDPLSENHGRSDISRLDHEYMLGIVGTDIRFGSVESGNEFTDPLGSTFYLSDGYKAFFKLESNYY
ncbi:MAG TPA: hypothetical protein PLC38_04085 [Methanobacterium sp.]|nr:hypothetical protein [Methanobacterium sp.]